MLLSFCEHTYLHYFHTAHSFPETCLSLEISEYMYNNLCQFFLPGSLTTSKMVNEYKRIVLLKGLVPISDDYFSLFKSLMARDLGLNRKKQKQCTRDQIADRMEDKFPDDAGLDKLIKFCNDLSDLRTRARILKKERSKGNKEQRTTLSLPVSYCLYSLHNLEVHTQLSYLQFAPQKPWP